jgi:hypothetical protein
MVGRLPSRPSDEHAALGFNDACFALAKEAFPRDVLRLSSLVEGVSERRDCRHAASMA